MYSKQYFCNIANEDGPDNEDEDEPQPPPPDNQTLLRLLEHHEKVLIECEIIVINIVFFIVLNICYRLIVKVINHW